ncbi:MAG: aminoacyltransferase, partial [Streptococcaceae bacterium]|nr:aminoacyltransferase [Streptococcaceae bacterium]
LFCFGCGPLLDFENKALLVFFLLYIKQFSKENGATYLEIDSTFLYQKRGPNGEVVEKAKDELIEAFKKNGFHHDGFTTGYERSVPRWSFVKDLQGLDEKTLLKSYTKEAIYSVKKTSQFGIQLRELGFDELDKFKALTTHTAERREFQDKTLEYYQLFYKTFKEKAKFIVAEINFKTYIENLRKREAELQTKLNRIAENLEKTPNSSKMLNQQKEFNAQMSTQEKRILEAEEFLKQEGEGDVILAGGLFVFNKKRTTYLFSGTYEQYKNFYAPFLIQHEMMLETLKRGGDIYDFYGIQGKFDGSDGVLKFKQSFNGHVEEKVGYFETPIRPITYKIYKLLHAASKRLRG